MKTSRKEFIRSALAASTGLMVPSFVQANALDRPLVEPIDLAIVKEFVLKSHNDFVRVQELLGEYPHLLNATVDWKDGDFETSIGAMAHMGYVDQVKFMLEKGARFDIFVLSLLGQTALVKSLIEVYPQALHSIGPHGFTLLHHAKKGGDNAKELYEYLQEKGLKDEFIKTFKD
ncbi:MAG: hypothetical protein SFV55_30065 [Haliscomenobacter sp.]|uniref:hypothetical protein n=1 Tax=Haliscomenobacter sp. TaxID=2717303 RepID=UPI0029A3C11E|nr:hypothetical protein [Haliscomenobacter sp.]MDX2072719.1 hypothetical protein [Haliscomenobacter sp.]